MYVFLRGGAPGAPPPKSAPAAIHCILVYSRLGLWQLCDLQGGAIPCV